MVCYKVLLYILKGKSYTEGLEDIVEAFLNNSFFQHHSCRCNCFQGTPLPFEGWRYVLLLIKLSAAPLLVKMCYCRALCTLGLYVKEWLHYWSPIKAEIRTGLLISIDFERLFDLCRCLHRNQSAVSLLHNVAQPLAPQIERPLRVCCWRSAREISAPSEAIPPRFDHDVKILTCVLELLLDWDWLLTKLSVFISPGGSSAAGELGWSFLSLVSVKCHGWDVLWLFGSHQKKKKKFKKSCIVKILLISSFRMASSSCHCPRSGMKVQSSQLLTVQDFLPPLCEGKAGAGVHQKIHLSKCISLSAFKLCAGGYQNICISF